MKENNYVKAMLAKGLILSFIGFVLGIMLVTGVIKSDVLKAIFYTLEFEISLDVIIYLMIIGWK